LLRFEFITFLSFVLDREFNSSFQRKKKTNAKKSVARREDQRRRSLNRPIVHSRTPLSLSCIVVARRRKRATYFLASNFREEEDVFDKSDDDDESGSERDDGNDGFPKWIDPTNANDEEALLFGSGKRRRE